MTALLDNLIEKLRRDEIVSLILTLVYQFYPGLSMHEFDKNNRFFTSFLGIVNKLILIESTGEQLL